MEAQTEKVTDKVAKLLAKAERAGTVEEAEAFAAKAQELMAKHAITEQMIRLATQAFSRDDVQTRVITGFVTTYYEEDQQLLIQIAKANDCEVIIYQYNSRAEHSCRCDVLGFAEDLANVELLYQSLVIQATVATKRYGKGLPPMHNADRRRSMKSFRFGFALGVGFKLREARAEAVQEAAAQEGGDNLPVLFKEKAELVAEAMPSGLRELKRRPTYNGDALRDGHDAGRAADAGTQGRIGR